MSIHENLPRVQKYLCCLALFFGASYIGGLTLAGAAIAWYKFVNYTVAVLKDNKIDFGFPPGDNNFEF